MNLSNYVEYNFTSKEIEPIKINRLGKSVFYPNHTFLLGNYSVSQDKYQFVKIEDRIIPCEHEYKKLTKSEMESLKIRYNTMKSDYCLFKNYKFELIKDHSDEGYYVKKIPL